jgi:hypothetical protein
MPFKFGVITLTEEPQTFVRVRIQLQNGREGWGMAAEVLGPKWFDKNPALSNEENLQQLRTSLAIAVELYTTDKRLLSPFDLFADNYGPQIATCRKHTLNPLIACYGPALLDRAILDALCRIRNISFYEAIRSNLVGIRASSVIPELTRFDFDAFLAGLKAGDRIHARHTVGLSDPLTDGPGEGRKRINDGLPETLEEVIAFYGNSYFKLKLCGQIESDIVRLISIAEVLDQTSTDYFVTLDGNEQYEDIEEVWELWRRIVRIPSLERFAQSVLFVEQPLSREFALEQNVSRMSETCPVIIDESDSDLDAFPRARYFGYRGVSSKQCKGFYKSIINSARCVLWNGKVGDNRFIMSGEDLTLQAGLAVQQDLALASLIGLTHLERNGHHYVRGMADLPEEEQLAFLTAHPDLYVKGDGFVRLRVSNGLLRIGSLACSGFASASEPIWSGMRQVSYRV